MLFISYLGFSPGVFFFLRENRATRFPILVSFLLGSSFYVPDILSQSVYVILFLIFYKCVSDMSFFYFLLLYGVRSRFFGVTAEIENNYILCYPFGVCRFNRRSLKSGMWTTDLRTGSPPKICKNSHRAESCGANVFFLFRMCYT